MTCQYIDLKYECLDTNYHVPPLSVGLIELYVKSIYMYFLCFLMYHVRFSCRGTAWFRNVCMTLEVTKTSPRSVFTILFYWKIKATF